MKTMGDVIRAMDNERLGIQQGDILYGGGVGALQSIGIELSDAEKESLLKNSRKMMIDEVKKVVEEDNHEQSENAGL